MHKNVCRLCLHVLCVRVWLRPLVFFCSTTLMTCFHPTIVEKNVCKRVTCTLSGILIQMILTEDFGPAIYVMWSNAVRCLHALARLFTVAVWHALKWWCENEVWWILQMPEIDLGNFKLCGPLNVQFTLLHNLLLSSKDHQVWYILESIASFFNLAPIYWAPISKPPPTKKTKT